MPSLNQKTLSVDELLGVALPGTFSLGNIPGFPASVYQDRKSYYETMEDWFTGEVLQTKQTQNGVVVDEFPVRINPIRAAVFKHAYTLFGEVRPDSGLLCQPVLKSYAEDADEMISKAQNFLTQTWEENSGRSLMMRNAILSQYLGGCVFKVSYVPEQEFRRIPIRIESIHPQNFVGVPLAGDEFRLTEAWVIKAISPYEAWRDFQINFDPETDEPIYYIEYWNPEQYRITINDIPITSSKVDPYTGEKIKYEGENPYGFVPFVYIPHIRTDGFYGESLISDDVQTLLTELARRKADYGDAVSADSHKYYVGSGYTGREDVYEAAPGVRIIHLPLTPSVTGKEQQGTLEEMGGPSASEPMHKLTAELALDLRHALFNPAVSDGEDEGSQRSGATLEMRFWPLTSHTNTERYYWTDGLSLLDSYVLKIAIEKGSLDKLISKFGLDESVLEMSIKRRWAPTLPRARTEFINELVNRASSKLGSQEHLMSLIDDIDDAAKELQRIQDEAQAQAEQNLANQVSMMEQTAKFAPKPEAGSGTKPGVASKGSPNPKGANSQSSKEK